VEVTAILPTSRTIAAKTTSKPLNYNSLSDATERNDTKQNHEVDMICPSGGMIAMNPPEASNDAGSSTGDSESVVDDEKQPAPRYADDRIGVSYFRRDPAGPPSARLEIGTTSYNLVFHPVDAAEAKLYEVCSPEWLQFYEQTMGEKLRAISRAHAGSDLRYVLSPVYDKSDLRGYRKPVLADHVALLEWSDELQPRSVIIIAEDEPTTISLHRVKQTSEKGPTHRGSLKFAA
jgi:hypothetical protein